MGRTGTSRCGGFCTSHSGSCVNDRVASTRLRFGNYTTICISFLVCQRARDYGGGGAVCPDGMSKYGCMGGAGLITPHAPIGGRRWLPLPRYQRCTSPIESRKGMDVD
jgi:hypothetical protein